MHDIRAIRSDAAAFDAAMARRNLPPASPDLLALDEERRKLVADIQERQTRRNQLAKEVGQGKRAGADTSALEAEATGLRDAMEALEARSTEVSTAINDRLGELPNILDTAVPDGRDETDNVTIAQHGTPPTFDFPAKQHFELGEALGLMQFEPAAKIAGARFTILRGALARLERALGQFMIDTHTTQHGYEEVAVPLLVNQATVYGTGQLPKFADDLFKTTDGRWLIPTAEVPLTNLAANDILPAASLPLRLTALTDCFRSEAGSAGRDTRGMLRQHQFKKVELVSITHPDDSAAEHERMTQCAEAILQALELPYRKILLCAGDTGFGSTKTYDLEVWLPGQAAWREISSCSNCRDFQGRRMNARFRGADGKVGGFVHTLNGSGVAVGRALIAVLENHQNQDGSIAIPKILRPYMGHQEIIA